MRSLAGSVPPADAHGEKAGAVAAAIPLRPLGLSEGNPKIEADGSLGVDAHGGAVAEHREQEDVSVVVIGGEDRCGGAGVELG